VPLIARDRAWTTAKSLPVDAFGDEPYLRLTNIAIAYADTLETLKKPSEAFKVLEDGFAILHAVTGADPTRLSGRERLREVAIAAKLGEMAQRYNFSPEKQKELLMAAYDAAWMVFKRLEPLHALSSKSEATVELLDLPKWATTVDLSEPFFSLAEHYRQKRMPR
jgi:hypothetical protein